MSGGGSSTPVNQTVTQNLTKDQQKLVDLAMPGLQKYAANPPKLPDFSRVAGFDPLQTQGQNAVLGATGQQQQVANNAGNATNFLLGPALDVNSNPYLQSAIAAGVRPIQENLVESTLPAIRSEAATTGNFGSSRQGIAEGLAAKGASQAIADTSARMASDAYNTGIGAMQNAIQLSPQTMANYLTPGLTMSGVGDVRQGQAQALLDQQASDFSYNQLAPYLTSSDLLAAAYGIPGGSTTASATGPRNSVLGGIGGGASLGSALGSVIPGIGTGIGTLAGGALGGLLSLF